MAVAANGVQLQQAKRHLILEDAVIGPFFRRERFWLDAIQAVVEIAIELVLLADSAAAVVVEKLIEARPIVLVVSDAGSSHRSESERGVNELLGELVQVLFLPRHAT